MCNDDDRKGRPGVYHTLVGVVLSPSLFLPLLVMRGGHCFDFRRCVTPAILSISVHFTLVWEKPIFGYYDALRFICCVCVCWRLSALCGRGLPEIQSTNQQQWWLPLGETGSDDPSLLVVPSRSHRRGGWLIQNSHPSFLCVARLLAPTCWFYLVGIISVS